MLASNKPASSLSLASSTLPVASATLPVAVRHSSSVTTISVYNQTHESKGKDESRCQAAYDLPSNFSYAGDPHIDALSLLVEGTLSKNFLTCKSPKVWKTGLDCVQCVEVFADSMNHCVPEWDAATGKEMDIIWDQTDSFSPSKGKWDLGHTKKSDMGFVPELDFEELCWEDGQLFVVMQGLNGKGTTKSRSIWQLNTDETTLTSVSPTTSALGTPRSAEMGDSSCMKMHTQEDELFSWLQHPPEDLVDRVEMPSDLPMLSTALADGERLYPSDPHRNLGSPQDFANSPAQNFSRLDNVATLFSSMGNKTGHGCINQQTKSAARPGLVPTATMPNKESCEPCVPLTAGVEMLSRSQSHSASVSMPCGTSFPNTSTSTMNFSNFSRPAVAIKANLHSLGFATGISGAERLKQLDRVAVDLYKSEPINSATKHLKLIAPRKERAALPVVPSFSHGVGASFVQETRQSFPPGRETKQNTSAACLVRRLGRDSSSQKEAEQDLFANGPLNRSFGMGIDSDGWNSSFASSTMLGMAASTEVLEVPEPSGLSSSGDSEDSDGVDGKRGSRKVKRNIYSEDSELRSDALEEEAPGSKKQAIASGNRLKRSKAAHSHNQSERRRRDRISEKMKALQALVPNSCKTDKASMLEEAIAYIKALKSQIQMMSYRGGRFVCPMLLPNGVQHVKMPSWPLINMGIGMNMGMGMNAGMGMYDMNTVMATAAPRELSPMMTFPSAIVPAVQATASAALDTTRGVAGHVIPHPAHQFMVSVRPGISLSGLSDSLPVVNGAPSQSHPTPQQGQPVQVVPMGAKRNIVPSSQDGFRPTSFMSGFK